MQSDFKINIAGLVIKVYIDNDLDGVREFMSNFITADISNKKPSPIIYISKNIERKLELSSNWRTLSIMGNDINDLTDPFTLIGLTQGIFRFAAIHLAREGTFLLHGSATTIENKIVCFGDDGSSIAKTLGSLEAVLISNQYVADEFCFVDIKTSKISGYPIIPIHLRPEVRDHLQDQHQLILPTSKYKNSIAGYFLQPDELFTAVSGKLEVLSYIHFSKTENFIEKLSTEDAIKSFRFCTISHIAKLLYPTFDRMQFSARTDSTEIKIIGEDVINEIERKLFRNQPILKFLKKVRSYRVTVTDPCKIVPQIMAEI